MLGWQLRKGCPREYLYAEFAYSMTAYLLLKIVKSMQYETIDILIAQFMPGSSSQVIHVREEQSQ